MKRLLSLYVLLLFVMSSFAYDAYIGGIYYVFNNNSGTATVTYYSILDDKNKGAYTGSITIPSSVTYNGKNYSVTTIGGSAFHFCLDLTSVTIPNSVTTIADKAFEDCSGLTSVTIPDNLTAIGEETFSHCNGLKSITIPENVTTIGNNAFYGCTGLTKVIVNDIAAWCNISFGTYGSGNPLDYAKHLYSDENTEIADLVIPDGVTNINDYAFHGCTSLKSITIPGSVTSIGSSAFEGCKGLTSITIPSSVTSIGGYAFSGCSGLASINIPESVTSIGSSAFFGTAWYNNQPDGMVYAGKVAYRYKGTMPANTAIVLDDGTLGIATYAFYGCKNLMSITIPESVTSIDRDAFYGCTGIENVTINSNAIVSNYKLGNVFGKQVKFFVLGKEITSIGDSAFYGCSSLTSISIPNSVTSIGGSAFAYCSSLTSMSIPNSVTSIGGSAFYGCYSLTSMSISNSVTSIGVSAFYGCYSLTSISIPNSVASIGNNAFYNCSGLKKVVVPDVAKWYSISFGNEYSNPLYYAKHLYSDDNTEITEIVIPKGVTSISSSAFIKCSGVKSIVVENGNAIYDSRENCNAVIETSTNTLIAGCKNSVIPSSITSIGDYAFYGQSDLTSITIPESVTIIGNNAFAECTSLTAVTLNNNAIVSRDSNPLRDIFGPQVKNYTIGEGVTSIGSGAFSGSSELTNVTIPSTVTSIGNLAFDGCSRLNKIYAKRGSKALVLVWNMLPYTYTYDTDTKYSLSKPWMYCTSTQTSLTFHLSNNYKEYTFSADDSQFVNGTTTVTGLSPETEYSRSLYVDGVYLESVTASTSGMNVGIAPQITASSVKAYGTYDKGDANVVSTSMTFNGKTVEGNSISVTGLRPNTKYTAKYDVVVAYGDNNAQTKTYSKTTDITTASLTLKTEQPKVVSEGNVIVSATTNVDDAETNVGFEWRREDWGTEIASSTGAAIAYGGTMEGYIRNMNTSKLWRYRAYYLSDSGTYYYGDWVGIDPSNTSYFEPTVRTYASVNVNGNTALVRGYALGGTDKVAVQGFKYWKTTHNGYSLDLNTDNEAQASSIPADAITETVDIVGAGQQLMNANLKNLDYSTTYHYVAFVTTAENETFYGEEQTFTTDVDPTGIEGVNEDTNNSKPITVVACYDINGKRLPAPQKGLNILRMSDGTTRKVVK